MKNVLVERSSKERIESISVGDLKFSMHDEFEYADGGIIIGLYDNELNMVAICKLPKPIKSLPDYPLNFIVRFDT